MARTPIMAAGGIVLRREQPPLIAVVRLRKRDEWVLPKGKLDEGETPRAAAKREVLEETGHSVTVHEFLGTLVYDTGARAKVVHYWRMEATSGEPTRELMDDVRAVDWLPLDAAVERLSRGHEKTFLENVGPYALAGLIRKTKPKPPPAVAPAKPAAASTKPTATAAKPAAAAKPAGSRRRSGREQPMAAAPPEVEPSVVGQPFVPAVDATPEALPAETAAEIAAAMAEPPSETDEPAQQDDEAVTPDTPELASEETPAVRDDVERVEAVAAEIKSIVSRATAPSDMSGAEAPEQGIIRASVSPDTVASAGPETSDDANSNPDGTPRPTLAQKMRAWLGRPA
jgi:8-oxo-dGTP diphosphatase